MAILLHGTTKLRADSIVANGPDPYLLGPDGFSTYLKSGPFLFGAPEEYACGKAVGFPLEGGAAIIEMDVPDEIIALAVDEYFPLSQGLIQFDEQARLTELRSAWPTIPKSIRLVECP